MNDYFSITVKLDLNLLKLIEEGAYLEAENKAIEHSRTIDFACSNNWNRFLSNSISYYYDLVKKKNIDYKYADLH